MKRHRHRGLNPFLFRSPSIRPPTDMVQVELASQSLLIQVSFHTGKPLGTAR